MKIFKIIILGTALVASSAAFADLMPEGQTLAQIASAAEPEGQTPAQIAAYPESNPGSGRVITGIDPLSQQMSFYWRREGSDPLNKWLLSDRIAESAASQ